ncbi:hypothetical protein BDD12DRAFT_983186 [Trichophaea hybrida]|nr:hypothetical protein BDD12DRAFT_983186 [Trichophaea hybrida]
MPLKRKTPTLGPTAPTSTRKSARIASLPNIRSDSEQPSPPRRTINRKRKQQPATGQESKSGSKRARTEKECSVPASGSSVLSDPPAPDIQLLSKCFRISNVPTAWNKDDLLKSLRGLGLLHDKLGSGDFLSLYPDCCDPSSIQTALLDFKECPASFLRFLHNDTQCFLTHDKRSDDMVDLLIDCQFYDLTPLNVPGKVIVADILAVTGMAGHAYGSWRNRESCRMWLKDFLPHDIQHIRVMSYGYNTNLVRSTVDDTILDYRRHFIEQLENARSSPEEKTRPIFFIGHSLGGILISQVLAQLKSNPTHRHLLDSTRGLFFFGTPHRGLQTAEIEAMVDDMTHEPESSRSRLVKHLQANSELLETQKEDLSDILDGRKIFSFYETTKTPTIQKSVSGKFERSGPEKMMVQQISALLYLPNEERIPVQQNHSNMVKFVSRHDPTYKTLIRCLRGCVNELFEHRANQKDTVENARSKDMLACLECLNVIYHQDYRDELFRKRHEGTFEWLLKDEQYRKWLQDDTLNVLWISGTPGCGKSVLSAFLSERLANKTGNVDQRQPVVGYFFCRHDNDDLRTETAILRYLLAQLLDEAPQLFEHFLPEFSPLKGKTNWTFPRLSKEDIGRYAMQEVSRLVESKNLDKTLRDYTSGALTKKAEGMFLWVSLVVEALRNDIDTSEDSIRKTLMELPIASQHQQKARTILQWVVSAKRPMTLEELKVAIAIHQDAASMGSMRGQIQRNIKGFLLSLFGSFLKIRGDSTVHLVHQTAREFLEGYQIKGSDVSSPNLDFVNICHRGANLELAISCLRYLCFDEFDEDPMIDRMTRWSIGFSADILDLQKKYPLLNYAALYWVLHARESDEENSDLWAAFQRLAQFPRRINLAHKVLLFSQFRAYNNDDFQAAEPLQILACHGLGVLMRRLLDNGACINVQSCNGTNALHAAIKSRHVPIVKLLLNRKANANIRSGRFRNAFEAAAAIGTKHIVNDILNALIETKRAVHPGARYLRVEMNETLMSPDVKITISEEVVTAAAENSDRGKEIMEALVRRHDVEFSGAGVAMIAKKFDHKLMKVLLAENNKLEITREIVTAASWNYSSGKEIMAILLSKNTNDTITAATVVAIVTSFGEEVVMNLLNRDAKIEISAKVVAAIARRCDIKVLRMFMARCDNIEITEEVVSAAAMNYKCPKHRRFCSSSDCGQIRRGDDGDAAAPEYEYPSH